MARVLLTGGRAPVALELARIFRVAGHSAFLAESRAGTLCQPSRAIQRFFQVPPPRQQREAFLRALEEIIQTQHIDLLVPTCEEVFAIAEGYERLSRHCRVCCEPLERLRPMHDKFAFVQLAAGCGLSVPETVRVQDETSLREAFRRWPRLVLKPVFSRFASRILIRPSLEDALRALNAHPTGWIAQEYLEGQALCSYSLAYKGRLSAHSTYRSAFTAGQGAAVHFRACLHLGILDWVQTFCARYGFSGQVAFDFIQTSAGKLYAIECNPRATSGLHLFAGRPELARAFLSPDGETLYPKEHAQDRMLTAAMLLYALPAAAHKRNLNAWAQAFINAQDVVFRMNDPLPALYQLYSLLDFVLLARRKGISPLEASTYDIEWNGEGA